MPQSLVKACIHLTFSTKDRMPLIPREMWEELHRYLGGVSKELGCPPIEVGGVEDHVHLLFLLSPKLALMKYVEEVKKNSSKWMKKKGIINFYWQRGYGGFSVNPSEISVAQHYIRNQEEHHRKMTFQEEYRKFLKKYGVDYDERYVWD